VAGGSEELWCPCVARCWVMAKIGMVQWFEVRVHAVDWGTFDLQLHMIGVK